LYMTAALLLLFFLTAILRKGIERLRLFLVLLLLASVFICYTYLARGFYHETFTGSGLEFTDLLPVRLADMPYLDKKRRLLRRPASTALMAVIWLLFLTVNISVLIQHISKPGAYHMPQNTTEDIGSIWLNRVRIILDYVKKPQTSWLRNIIYPCMWILLPVIALLKLGYEVSSGKTARTFSATGAS
jgi:hypothetical protein